MSKNINNSTNDNSYPHNDMNHYLFVQKMVEELTNPTKKHNKTTIERIAGTYGIDSKNDVKELIELAIVETSRGIAHNRKYETSIDKYIEIVEMYKSQVNLSHRTSQSMLLQQYSTPAPIGYLMGLFCKIDKPNIQVFEPSAGNGLLTIAANPNQCVVNEIDTFRNGNLQTQGFKQVLKKDATIPFLEFAKTFDAVITNPPFGTLNDAVNFGETVIKTLDHLMAIRALNTMKDNGRCAIIIGGHTTWDEHGRIQKGKNRIFFSYLHKHYNVLDTINLDGDLYSKQGTSFDVRIILIDGRKENPEGFPPLENENDKVVKSFNELWERVSQYINPKDMYKTFKMKALALEVELSLLNIGELGAPYMPGSKGTTLKVDTPDSMSFEQQNALQQLAENVGDIDKFVQDKLGYTSQKALFDALSAEQIDAVALAIYNIEKHNESLIVSDQTGIGKGRIAAAVTRYAIHSGRKPIFVTEKPNLFSDIYRDLMAIGSEDGSQILRKALGFEEVKAVYKKWSSMLDEEKEEYETEEAYNEYKEANPTTQKFRYEKNSRYDTKKGKHVVPLIINSKSSKSEIKDIDGNVLYEGLEAAELKEIMAKAIIPAKYDCVMLTYSQISHGGKLDAKLNISYSPKQAFLKHIAKGNIIIMDESHNASGQSKTGIVLSKILEETKGVLFLSATYAKRPDSMPIYAKKTVISEAALTSENLVAAIDKGGVAFQEVLSSELVRSGQLIRRERTFEGIEVNYIYLDKTAELYGMEDKEQEHKAIFDKITAIIRDIIAFETDNIQPEIKDLDKIISASHGEVTERKGGKNVGVDNAPFVSKVFNTIQQLLFAIKAPEVAKRAIQRLKEGKKPVIAFANTMGSFIESLDTEDGGKVNADFATVLMKALNGTLRYTEYDSNGKATYKKFDLNEFSQEVQEEYNHIAKKIRNTTSGIVISPIDLIKQEITNAGYSVAEVTGRKYELKLQFGEQKSKGKSSNNANAKSYSLNHSLHAENDLLQLGNIIPNTIKELHKGDSFSGKGSSHIYGTVLTRQKENANDAFRRFNNNEVDVLMINQSGSTGASAHAIPTNRVKESQVKQRVMIVLQAELDINVEVQKRGRVNRTGQIYKPIYDYVISAIPAEMRLMMMLQKKLKSLDANTTSNQRNSESLMNFPDFLNKYGNKIVTTFLNENPEFNIEIGDPLHLTDSQEDSEKRPQSSDNAAHKVSGRVAILSTKQQEDFYTEVLDQYTTYVDYLKQTGAYDLEIETLPLQAKTIAKYAKIVGKGGRSTFGDNTYLETCEVNILKKPFTADELDALHERSLGGKTPDELRSILIQGLKAYYQKQFNEVEPKVAEKYGKLIEKIPKERAYQKLKDDFDKLKYIEERTEALENSRDLEIVSEQRKSENKYGALYRFASYFQVGKALYYVDESNPDPRFAVFLGFSFNEKTKNPFAPSAVKLQFAIADSRKAITIAASQNMVLTAIMGATTGNNFDTDWKRVLDLWERNLTRGGNSDRGMRMILTGNLLQALGDSDFGKGKLISFSTFDGGQRKGLLLPESFIAQEKDSGKQNYVTVPILKAYKILQGMSLNSQFGGDEMTIIRKREGYSIVVEGSRSKGGYIYLNEKVMVAIGGFDSVSGKMVAAFSEEKLYKLCQALDSINVTIKVHKNNIDTIEDIIEENKPEIVEVIPSQITQFIAENNAGDRILQVSPSGQISKIKLMKMKALAIEVELQLLSF